MGDHLPNRIVGVFKGGVRDGVEVVRVGGCDRDREGDVKVCIVGIFEVGKKGRVVGVGGAGEFFECVDGDDPGRDGRGEVLQVKSSVEWSALVVMAQEVRESMWTYFAEEWTYEISSEMIWLTKMRGSAAGLGPSGARML